MIVAVSISVLIVVPIVFDKYVIVSKVTGAIKISIVAPIVFDMLCVIPISISIVSTIASIDVHLHVGQPAALSYSLTTPPLRHFIAPLHR